MTLKEILEGKDPSQQVAYLTRRRGCSSLPEVDKMRKQIEPDQHEINDKSKRPDKPITEERIATGSMKKEKVVIRYEEVNRIFVSLQRLIVDRAVSFLFANRVNLINTTEDEAELKVLEAIKTINYDNKIDSFNRRLAREVMSYTEAAEYWYPVDRPEVSEDYGFKTDKRLRVVLWTPSSGDKLFPFFDDYGDLIAFSRMYSITEDEKSPRTCVDTFTADFFYHYERINDRWTEPVVTPNPIGKIPVVYYAQEKPEYSDVEPMIARLEKLLSNFAETNDYHSAPKIFVTGKILGWAKKGESGSVIEGDPNAKAQYLSWDHAPESVRLEIDTLLRLIYSMTQTPDISFDAVKGMGGDFSGVALKLLFMDAHLKARNKEEIFGGGIQRRTAIQKAYIAQMDRNLDKGAKSLRVRPEFNLFMIENEKEKVEVLLAANGNNPIMSQKETVRRSGVEDPGKAWEEIQEEADLAAQRGNMADAIGL